MTLLWKTLSLAKPSGLMSIMHTTTASYVDTELKSAGDKINVSNIAAAFELPDYLKAKPSPSLLKREAEKNFKYARLITVAQRQTKEKKRLQCPTFTSFIVSDFGDLSPAAVELQEWLVTCFAKKCEREGARAEWMQHYRHDSKLPSKTQAECPTGRRIWIRRNAAYSRTPLRKQFSLMRACACVFVLSYAVIVPCSNAQRRAI